MTGAPFDHAVVELLGAPLAGMLHEAFASLDIAERVIAEARNGAPVDREDPVWWSFRVMRPGDVPMPEILFESHCREMIDRVREGADTRPGTDAELLTFLSEATLRGPATQEHATLYRRLFARRFPAAYKQFGNEDLDAAEDMWGRDADRLEVGLRERFAQAWRT